MTSQTLYPTTNMQDVDELLLKASECLKTSLIAEMEASQADAHCIEQVRQSTAGLTIEWNPVLLSFRTAVYASAYQRYRDWHTTRKRKRSFKNSSSQKKPRGGRGGGRGGASRSEMSQSTSVAR